MKTTFSPGVAVTTLWLNGAKNLNFLGLDEDWSYDPLDLTSIVTVGTNGLDTSYVTLSTQQTITNIKNFTSTVNFNGTATDVPTSTSTNLKWNSDINNLADEDLMTKIATTTLLTNLDLNSLGDVNCNAPLDDYILSYDEVASEWTCNNVVFGGTY